MSKLREKVKHFGKSLDHYYQKPVGKLVYFGTFAILLFQLIITSSKFSPYDGEIYSKNANLIIEFLVSFRNNIDIMSSESILMVYFTVLTIFVTLVSVTSVLTREIRQDLIIRYYFGTLFVISYLSYLLISFFLIYITKGWEYSYYFNQILFMILFVWTTFFVVKFIENLTREYFYLNLFEKFKKEFTNISKKNDEKISSQNYQLKSLDDFIRNIGYVQNTSSDFREETSFLKKIIAFCLKNNKVNIIENFFNDRDAFKINNLKYFEDLIDMFIELVHEKEKPTCPSTMNLYQKLMYKVIRQTFYSINVFSPKVNTSGLYIKEFMDFNTMHYEKAQEKNWIDKYHELVKNTIDRLSDLSEVIISIHISDVYKRRYLISMLENLNKSLENLEIISTKMREGYNVKVSPNDNNVLEKELKIKKVKLDFIDSAIEELEKKMSKIFYLLLYNIEMGELTKDYFNLVIRLYKTNHLKNQFKKKEPYDKLNHLNYDFFEGRAQTVGTFNFNKYRLLILFYEYLYSKEKDRVANIIKKFDKEILSGENGLIEEVDKLNMEFIKKFFNNFQEKDIEEFKEEVKGIVSTENTKN